MSTMRNPPRFFGFGRTVVALVVTCLPFGLTAMDVQDVVDLKAANIGDDVILAQAKAEHAQLKLKTEDLKTLKAAGCSDKLIIALMTGFETATATPAAPTAAPAANTTPAPATTDTTLELEMLDDTDLDIAINAQTYTIQVARAGMLGGGVGQSWRLTGGQRQTIKVPAGTYTVQWDEDDQRYTVRLGPDLTTKLIFSQASTKMYDAVYLSIFRGDTRIDGGRLHMLKIKSEAFTPASTQNPQEIRSAAVTMTGNDATAELSSPAPRPAVETRTVVVHEPVYVRQPVYVSSPVYVAPPVRYVYTRTYTGYCAPSYRPVHRPTYRYPSYCGTASVTTRLGRGTYGSLGIGCNGLSLGIGGRSGHLRVNLGGCR